MKELTYEDFPLKNYDKIRYADTDRQGHVNNAVFNTFLETGRVEVLYHPEHAILGQNCNFVIANLNLKFLKEIHWPGEIQIGTGVARVGNSSMTLFQRLFQKDVCVAEAETVIVHVSNETTRGHALSSEAKAKLGDWKIER